MSAVATGKVDVILANQLHSPWVILRTELLHTRFRVKAGDAAEVVCEGVQRGDGIINSLHRMGTKPRCGKIFIIYDNRPILHVINEPL